MDQQLLKHYGPFVKPTDLVTWATIESEIHDGIASIEEFNGVIGLGAQTLSDTPSSDAISSVRHDAKFIFDYALEGKIPTSSTPNPDFDPLLDFSAFTGVARITGEIYGMGAVPTACEKLLIMALLRSELDEYTNDRPAISVISGSTGLFTLFEIAVLAQMHEKSVRNATQPTANDRLETIRVGTRTMVEPKAALRWLSNRRSFTPTQIIGGGEK